MVDASKKERYQTAKILAESGAFKSIKQILDYIPPEELCPLLKISPDRLEILMINPEHFQFGHTIAIGELLGVDGKEIINILDHDIRPMDKR